MKIRKYELCYCEYQNFYMENYMDKKLKHAICVETYTMPNTSMGKHKNIVIFALYPDWVEFDKFGHVV